MSTWKHKSGWLASSSVYLPNCMTSHLIGEIIFLFLILINMSGSEIKTPVKLSTVEMVGGSWSVREW